jgi:hypothetical protein
MDILQADKPTSFFGQLERNSLNIYRKEKRFKQKLQRKIIHKFYAPTHFFVSITIFEIIKPK